MEIRFASGLFEIVEMNMNFKPKPYVVYVRVAPYPNCGFKDEFVGRVGPAENLKEARSMILEDRRAMGDTYGGLIDAPGTKGRTYEVWEASWKKVA